MSETIGMPVSAKALTIVWLVKPLGYVTGQFGKNHPGGYNAYGNRRIRVAIEKHRLEIRFTDDTLPIVENRPGIKTLNT